MPVASPAAARASALFDAAAPATAALSVAVTLAAVNHALPPPPPPHSHCPLSSLLLTMTPKCAVDDEVASRATSGPVGMATNKREWGSRHGKTHKWQSPKPSHIQHQKHCHARMGCCTAWAGISAVSSLLWCSRQRAHTAVACSTVL